jgi:DNA-directed RNA polymerase subunit RPC12/RpoP
MAIATVACPKCKKTFRGKDEIKNKRIKCPLCAFAFVVDKFEGEKEPPKEPAAAAADDDDDGKNPYGVTTIALVPRCPNCANEMESEAAIICLYCGYNTQTRTLGITKSVVAQTGGDKAKWLTPGIGAALLILTLILFQNFYVFGIGGWFRGEDAWWTLVFTEPIYLWLTLIIAGVSWVIGRFAFKRLLLEPTPPEAVKD